MTKKTNNCDAEEVKPAAEEKAPEKEEKKVKPPTVDDLIEKLAAMQDKLEKETKRADDMTDSARRIQAEFDNFRRRTREEAGKARENALVEVIVKVLPSLDVIENALKMLDDEKVVRGVEMIRDELLRLLAGYDVAEIAAAGEPFDPRVHEAVMQVPAETDEERDTVKEVFQKGYRMGERILRPARVIVSK